ncbi:hypothetical protein O3M35_011535 [Rhynocoris fuscipes]|uniref:Alanine--glyoxylate aminotransferase 2, mitochondrial n=1 Tax=Rhynocoris fuscipes TaxID=488301 RepID=A0AAW1D2R1_9HEMI
MKNMFGRNFIVRGLIKNENFRKFTTNQRPPPVMPSCDYKPKQYEGPDFDTVQKIKEKHIVPCIKQYYKEPLLLHEGHMQWLFDHNGRRYLDMFSGIVTVSAGHCHPKVTKETKDQIDKLWHTTNIYLHPKLYEYAEKLTAKLPGNLKVAYFVNSGSEANDLAMLITRIYTGNFDIISFRNAYHGLSPYSMGMTALSFSRHDVPSALGIHHAMNPDVYRGLWGGAHCRDSPVQTDRKCDCAEGKCQAADRYYEQLEEVFMYSLAPSKVAALFAESIQGVGGTVQFPKGFLKKAYELVRSNGGLCVADEVQTGFGRTGDYFWGFESHEVIPDIVTMAKGIGNGYPLAAVVTTPEISQALGHAFHFNTFGGNPVACTAGMATLEVIEEEGLQKNSKIVGTYLLEELAKLRDEFAYVGDVRGKGLMIGVDLVKNKATREPIAAKHFADIWEDCKDMGVLLGRGGMNGNVIRIKPPMCVTKQDADFTVQVLRTALEKFTEKCEKCKTS